MNSVKKIIVLLAFGLSSGAAYAAPQQPHTCFHLGAGKGKGTWVQRSAKATSSSPYSVEGKIENDEYDFHYVWDNGHKAQINFKVRCEGDGFFEILDRSGQVAAGQGYCLGQTCHYSTVFDGGRVEETITLVDGKYIKTGSKIVEGERIAWREDLEVVE